MNKFDQLVQDFPLLQRKIHDKPIIYLDSTATSLKPQLVIDAERSYYTNYTANIFRGIYTLSEEATALYEAARVDIAKFIGAADPETVIFTRNTTEAINMICTSLVAQQLNKGDAIAVTIMEHHSNFVPWQQVALTTGADFVVIPTNEEGKIIIEDLDKYISTRTKVFAFTAISNVLGTINPVKEIIAAVKKINPNCIIVVDAAQAVPHMRVDVQDWDADFIAFSGHKMLGPTGIGVLWGKRERLESMKPFLYGGEMIQEVRIDKSTFKKIPHLFEAGTPHIAGSIGLGAAVTYLNGIGMDAIRAHEQEITQYALQQMKRITGIKIYGPRSVEDRGGIIAFSLSHVHPHDIAQILDSSNICIRSGNHCAMPLHTKLGIAGTARASFYIYTTKSDIDIFVNALEQVLTTFV